MRDAGIYRMKDPDVAFVDEDAYIRPADLKTPQDENDESHENAMEWLEDDFDPSFFDAEKANSALRAIFRRAPVKGSKSANRPKRGRS